MATTTHFAESGGLYRDPVRPLHAPRVYKVGDKAGDARFLADGYTANTDSPENDYNIIESAGRFAAFDKKGDLIRLADTAESHGSLMAHNNPTAESVSTSGRTGTAYLVVFSASQLAELLERFDGEATTRGRPAITFDRPPPIQVVELLNPHTDEVEPVLVLNSVPKFSVVAKVVGKLIRIKEIFRTEHSLNLFVCLDEIFGLESAYHHETDPEKKGLALKAVDEAKANFADLIPDEAKIFHNLTTNPEAASASRAELHKVFYENQPAHRSALKLIEERKAALDTPKE